MRATRIPLSQGLYALIDEEDLERVVAAGAWSAAFRKTTVYAARSMRRPDGRRSTVYLHAFLTGWPRIDHANGDGLDNRRANLRPATRGENGRNARRRSDNRSGYKGVGWNKQKGKWQSRIKVDGRRIHVGLFDDLIEAARARDAAAIEHHGEFARLNFVPKEAA